MKFGSSINFFDFSALILQLSVDLYIFSNRREATADAIIGALLVFNHSKNLNCIGALSFKICSHIFMIFEVKLK